MAIKIPDGGLDDDNDFGPIAEINVTPLVDVMLVLLIIFMVAAPLMIAGVPVNLPQTAAARQNPPQKPMVITIAPGGALYIRDEQIAAADLVNRLRELRAAEGDAVAYVRSDASIPYGEVMAILGGAGEAGYARISLLSQPKPQASPAGK
jgi:biopolymer transport protein TolR